MTNRNDNASSNGPLERIANGPVQQLLALQNAHRIDMDNIDPSIVHYAPTPIARGPRATWCDNDYRITRYQGRTEVIADVTCADCYAVI